MSIYSCLCVQYSKDQWTLLYLQSSEAGQDRSSGRQYIPRRSRREGDEKQYDVEPASIARMFLIRYSN